MKSGQRKNRNYKGYVLLGFIILYIAIFSLVAHLKYQSFSFQDMDLAAINQAFWNATRGNFIHHDLGQSVLFSGHKWAICFFLLPIYALFPGSLTLLFLQSLALGLGAWAVYLIARAELNPRFGLLFSFSYLIYPALNYVNLYEFHPLAFATPLLLFAFYFYQKRRWGLFILLIVISLAVREDVAIPVFGMGLFALLQGILSRDEKFWTRFKWGLTPVFLALLWFLVCTKFTPVKSTSTMESFYSWLGGSPGEILKTIIFHPVIVLKGVLIRPKLLYLLYLFVPLGFVSLLSPSALIMVLVALAEALLSQRFTHFSIRYQYSSIITPLIFISAIYGVRNILKWKFFSRDKKKSKSFPVIIFMVILICSVTSALTLGPLPRLPEGIKLWRFTEEDGVRESLVEMVPPRIPVITTFAFAPKLSTRPQLFFFYHVYSVSGHANFRPYIPASQKACRYALIDFDDWLTFYDFYSPEGYKSVFNYLIDGEWQLVTMVNSLALFRKSAHPYLGVVGSISKGDKVQLRNIGGIPELKFAGFNLEKKTIFDQPVINLEIDLKCENRINDNILLAARFTSRADRSKGFQQFFFAPYRIYPTSLWRPGEIVRQSCNILVPQEMLMGDYDLTLTLFRKRSGLPFTPEAKKHFYGYYDTAMALRYLPGKWGISPDRLVEQIIIARIPDAVKL